MLLGLELEEFFAVHNSSSRRTSSETATATARGKRDTHTLSIHLCSSIEPGFTLCFRTKTFGGLYSGSIE
jgi:hypothetical protein